MTIRRPYAIVPGALAGRPGSPLLAKLLLILSVSGDVDDDYPPWRQRLSVGDAAQCDPIQLGNWNQRNRLEIRGGADAHLMHLLANAHIVTRNGSEQQHQQGNQDDDDPGAMVKLRHNDD